MPIDSVIFIRFLIIIKYKLEYIGLDTLNAYTFNNVLERSHNTQ